MCKAYRQIPLPNLSPFSLHRSLMEFCQFPFRLTTVCSIFIRLMKIKTPDLPNISHFDIIFIHSSNWPSHIAELGYLLHRLHHHKLTAKPRMCLFWVPSVGYLGIKIEGVHLRPLPHKAETLKQFSPHTTKKYLRSSIGIGPVL